MEKQAGLPATVRAGGGGFPGQQLRDIASYGPKIKALLAERSALLDMLEARAGENTFPLTSALFRNENRRAALLSEARAIRRGEVTKAPGGRFLRIRKG
mgnify:CR=1 FL=1